MKTKEQIEKKRKKILDKASTPVELCYVSALDWVLEEDIE